MDSEYLWTLHLDKQENLTVHTLSSECVFLGAAAFRTHRQPLDGLQGQVRILTTLRLRGHGQSLIPGSQREADSWLIQAHRVSVDHIQSPVSVVLESCWAPAVLHSPYFLSCFCKHRPSHFRHAEVSNLFAFASVKLMSTSAIIARFMKTINGLTVKITDILSTYQLCVMYILHL